jgi:hypothetical protein
MTNKYQDHLLSPFKELDIAISKDDWATAKTQLLKHGVNIELDSSEKITPFQAAIIHLSTNVMRNMLTDAAIVIDPDFQDQVALAVNYAYKSFQLNANPESEALIIILLSYRPHFAIYIAERHAKYAKQKCRLSNFVTQILNYLNAESFQEKIANAAKISECIKYSYIENPLTSIKYCSLFHEIKVLWLNIAVEIAMTRVDWQTGIQDIISSSARINETDRALISSALITGVERYFNNESNDGFGKTEDSIINPQNAYSASVTIARLHLKNYEATAETYYRHSLNIAHANEMLINPVYHKFLKGYFTFKSEENCQHLNHHKNRYLQFFNFFLVMRDLASEGSEDAAQILTYKSTCGDSPVYEFLMAHLPISKHNPVKKSLPARHKLLLEGLQVFTGIDAKLDCDLAIKHFDTYLEMANPDNSIFKFNVALLNAIAHYRKLIIKEPLEKGACLNKTLIIQKAMGIYQNMLPLYQEKLCLSFQIEVFLLLFDIAKTTTLHTDHLLIMKQFISYYHAQLDFSANNTLDISPSELKELIFIQLQASTLFKKDDSWKDFIRLLLCAFSDELDSTKKLLYFKFFEDMINFAKIQKTSNAHVYSLRISLARLFFDNVPILDVNFLNAALGNLSKLYSLNNKMITESGKGSFIPLSADFQMYRSAYETALNLAKLNMAKPPEYYLASGIYGATIFSARQSTFPSGLSPTPSPRLSDPSPNPSPAPDTILESGVSSASSNGSGICSLKRSS